ncbi:MAG TPA: tyrosinase family protein [Pyrinomonadaceae bacterium]|nr:tyrosinase family protein [Pyrinomonadaceae bacterium]
MNVEIQINNSPNANARFVTWAPAPCRIRITNPAGAQGQGNPQLRISARTSANGGALVFRRGAAGQFAATLTLGVPINGNWVSFFAAGQFGRPSVSLGDVQIVARHGNSQQSIGATPCTVRIRKNANTLTPAERDRFIAAFAQLNNQGLGRFADFRDMHTNVSSPQAHGRPGFLPWHRAYLLDLERELQAIDPSVALHYWRFDRPSPNIFKRDFLGESDNLGTVFFSATNPLQFWVTDGVPGINRRPFFDTNQATGVRTEPQTLALGTTFPPFRTMEGNPHGSAHTSFGGSISSIPTAARDPLFFLLHCNVDRLWAKWQQINNRFNPAVAASFDENPANPPGHRLADTMWPWNGITTPPRPPTAPGGTMAPSPVVSAPGLSPRVRDTLDFQGKIGAAAVMGFDYDDVPFS